jgi:hypothetical protein
LDASICIQQYQIRSAVRRRLLQEAIHVTWLNVSIALGAKVREAGRAKLIITPASAAKWVRNWALSLQLAAVEQSDSVGATPPPTGMGYGLHNKPPRKSSPLSSVRATFRTI